MRYLSEKTDLQCLAHCLVYTRCSIHRVLFLLCFPFPQSYHETLMKSRVRKKKPTVLSRAVCLEEVLFPLFLPSFLAGLFQGQPKNTFPKMYLSVKMLHVRSHMQRRLGNAVYSSSPFEAYDTQYLSKASWKSCSDKTLCDSNPRLSSGVVEPLLCSAPTEHPQGDAASQHCDCSQS